MTIIGGGDWLKHPHIYQVSDTEAEKVYLGLAEYTDQMRVSRVSCIYGVHIPQERRRWERLSIGNVRTLYHSTKRIKDVLNSGLSIAWSKEGYLGKGIYFTTCADKAYRIGGCDLLVCEVRLGNVHTLLRHKHLTQINHQKYHSVYVPRKDHPTIVTEVMLNFDEYVAFSDAQVTITHYMQLKG